jgi:hypothetical protein
MITYCEDGDGTDGTGHHDKEGAAEQQHEGKPTP